MGERVLFLDIDGVLATSATYRRCTCPHLKQWIPVDEVGWHREDELLGASQVKWLNILLRLSGARLVLSTSWREQVPYARLAELLRMAGVETEISGYTPPAGERRDEIAEWMREHDVAPEDVVILEDREAMGDLEGRTVRTTMRLGLGRRHVRRALALWGLV